MKRDMDLIRDLLLRIEARETVKFGRVELPYEDYAEEQIYYHVRLLHEAGYIHAANLSTGTAFCWEPVDLTWQGHEFLDNARDEEIWNRAKAIVRDAGGAVSFDILKTVLTGLVTSVLGLR
jgi:hypothetical protein